MAAVAILLALLVGPGAPVFAVSQPRPIDIRGNMVLVDDVYMAALHLSFPVVPNADTARTVEQQILNFLRRAGYTLATVQARPVGNRIEVKVDEGRLSRIVVRGRDVVSSLAVKLNIDLPHDVFNRPQLERLLQAYRVEGARVNYRLVPARVVQHTGPQVNPLALLPGSAPLPPDGRYELHIDFTGLPERDSLSLRAGADSDAIRAGAAWTGVSKVLRHDRWELETLGGANYFQDLRRQVDELRFSRVLGGARWLVSRLGIEGLWGTLRFREDLLRRQRQDLRVNSYWWNRVEATTGVSFKTREGSEISAEVGAQQRDLFAIDQLMDVEGIPVVLPSSELRPFVALFGRLVFQPDRLRLDRRERIDFEGRYFPGFSASPFWYADLQYRRVFEFGWNELWLRGNFSSVAGDYSIADAIPMHYLRGVFGRELYLDRAAAVEVEYRLSLTRDIFKVGFFNDAVLYREAQRVDRNGPRAADSFGPSFHALVLDVFQLDFFYAFGFAQNGAFDHGISIQLEKAF